MENMERIDFDPKFAQSTKQRFPFLRNNVFHPEPKHKHVSLSLYVDRQNFFHRILSLQINPSNILVCVVFHSNSLPHSDTRLYPLFLNLTKNLITGPNNTLKPLSILLLPGQPRHELTCFSPFCVVSFMFLATAYFPFFSTGSVMHFVFASDAQIEYLRICIYCIIYLQLEVSSIALVCHQAGFSSLEAFKQERDIIYVFKDYSDQLAEAASSMRLRKISHVCAQWGRVMIHQKCQPRHRKQSKHHAPSISRSCLASHFPLRYTVAQRNSVTCTKSLSWEVCLALLFYRQGCFFL